MSKGILTYIDENGNEKQILTKNSAELVKYDNAGTDTTVADFLANISAGSAETADFATRAEKDSAGNVISTTYAPIDSPNFTGAPTAPTVTDLDLDNNQIASVGYVKNQIKKLTGVVPAELDTFEELYNAMGQDSDLSTTIATKLAAKQDSDTTLTAIAELPLTANQTFYTTGSKNFAPTDFKEGGRELLSKATAREIRKALGVYRNLIFDECEKNWTYDGSPTVADGVLNLDGSSYIQSGDRLPLGGPFTIELKGKSTVQNPSGSKYFLQAYCTNGWRIAILQQNGTNKPFIHLVLNDSTVMAEAFDDHNVADGNFHDFALSFDGTNFRFFVDGNLKKTAAGSLVYHTYYIFLGALSTFTNNLTGAIDEFRVSNSCRYTENYTPEERFSVDENTVSLLHFD